MEKAIKTYVMSQLRTGQVTMWTTSSSPKLSDTEQLLENERVPYEEIDIEKNFPGE